MPKKLVILSLLALSASANAELTIPGIALKQGNASALAATDKTLAKTGLAVNEDDITTEQDPHALILTPLQLHEARVWGLTDEEEKRFVFLMQNRSAIYYKGLRQTPLDILGINARNELERTHFAKLSALTEAQKISKNIAWNNAFYKAYNHLFRDIPVVGEFDATPFSPVAYKPIVLNQGDTLFLFIKPEDAVKTILLALIDAIQTSPNSKLHLMLLGAQDLAIQQWANQQQIPRELVARGAITLNHGDLNFEALSVTKKSTPLLILARDKTSRLVDLGVF